LIGPFARSPSGVFPTPGRQETRVRSKLVYFGADATRRTFRAPLGGDPRIAPDGKTVAFVAWGIDRKENEYSGSIWLFPLDGLRVRASVHLERKARTQLRAGRRTGADVAFVLEPGRQDEAALRVQPPAAKRRAA
jgi:dipeptidyl aminopeptidase/acylaminoacyl peptidase